MKHIARLFILAVAIVFTACSDSTIMPEVHEPNGGSRATVPEEVSESNPALLSDWENCSTIYLNELSGNTPLCVTSPWESSAPTNLKTSFRTDIKKTDGWIMLFHTFTRASKNRRLSYMCFYNQFSGYVKVFYYVNDANVATESVWSVTSNEAPTPRAIFSDSEYFSQPLDGDDVFTVWSITADNMLNSNLSALSFGWNGFEFRVGTYNPKNSDGDFDIKAYNTTYTNFSFTGEETSTTTGTITTINTNEKSIADNALAKAVINYTGEQAKNTVENLASKFLNKNILGINFKDILSNLTTGDYAKAITNGLGSIFKSIIKFKKEPQYSVSQVKLQTKGTIALKGTSATQTAACIEQLTFSLKRILEADRTTRNEDSDIYDRLSAATNSKIELGVWNLRKKPTLYYERYTKFANELGIPEDHSGAIDFHGLLDYPQTRVGDIEVVFNPAIAKYVKSYSVTTNVVDVVGGNRYINNKGKLVIAYNRDNKLTSTDSITSYGVDYLNRDLFLMVDGLLDKVSINNDTQLYIDWGDNVGGNRAAVVTLTMNVDYNGNEFSFTESRVYDVVYVPTTNGLSVSYFNNPPSSYILNQAGNTIYNSNLYSY